MEWIERVKINLLPVSEEKRDVKRALKEWKYLGDAYDLDFAEEVCQLCDHPGIRYQFEIVNTLNGNSLLIGSECINRFDIGVMDNDGATLQGEKAKKKVSRDRNKLISDAKLRSVINTLVELSNKDDRFDINNFIDYYKEREAFTPKQLSLLIDRLDKYQIEYNKNYFKLTIRRKREKEQLLEMDSFKILKLWPSLSSSQKKFLADNENAIAKTKLYEE